MKIILAEEIGFCFGANRAIRMALAESKKGPINTFGPLVHNPSVLERLRRHQINIAGDIGEINTSRVILRAHGVSAKTKKAILDRGIEIIDATCPFVKNAQNAAEKFNQRNYQILILGEKEHPEVIGIRSYASKAIVIKSIKDIPKFPANEKIVFLSQTTQNVKTFEEISKYLKKNFKKVEIVKTICNATDKRQKAVGELAKKVDVMIIIGGKNSSNTTRLKEVSEKITKTYHVETEKELKKDWFKKDDVVGVATGASTPMFSVEEVVVKLKTFN